jgi:hypothetical protein
MTCLDRSEEDATVASVPARAFYWRQQKGMSVRVWRGLRTSPKARVHWRQNAPQFPLAARGTSLNSKTAPEGALILCHFQK